MGLLGLDTAFLLSERVFQLMDEDQDGEVLFLKKIGYIWFSKLFKISLSDFIYYMDVLLNGTTEKKNELSFKMIDYRKKGFFEKSDLKELIESTIMVWSHLTGNQLSKFCIVSLGNRFFHKYIYIYIYIYINNMI